MHTDWSLNAGHRCVPQGAVVNTLLFAGSWIGLLLIWQPSKPPQISRDSLSDTLSQRILKWLVVCCNLWLCMLLVSLE